jgi:multiple sugar transport system permease protein
MPWLLGFLLFTLGPMVASVFFSLTKWDLLTAPQFIGLDNFRNAFREELFWKSLYNTGYYTFLAIPLQMFTAVLLAVALNTKIHGTRLYRTLYYIPSLTPVVASSVLWIWFFNPNYGIANAFLKLFGLPPQMWFLDIQLAKPTFVLISLWGVGSSMIIILAGLQGVPQELYEAAEIDGANLLHRFRNVTLPLITPVIFFNLILGIINSFQVFTSAFIITQGGPYNATLFYFLYLYRNAFQYFKMGYASALAWLLFFIILAFTMVQVRLSDRWVYYEAKSR